MTALQLRSPEEPASLALAAAPELTTSFHPELAALVASEALLTPQQCESALRAIQALGLDLRSFFLGHGPGVGKTRILAAVARHLQLTREQARILWLVPNQELCKQAKQEVKAFGLEWSSRVILASYAQLATKKATQLLASGDLLILDEAHVLRGSLRAKGLVEKFQGSFEGVIYSTATAASQVSHIGYMQRLGLWGPGTSFPGFSDLCQALRRWGPSAAELLAIDLKQRGLYTCLRLPSTELVELELSPSQEIVALFDDVCQRWKMARHAAASDLFSFMKRLVTSLKCRCMLPRWRRDVEAGYAVAIVLQGTGSSCEGESLLWDLCRRNGVQPPEQLPLDALDEVQLGLAPTPVAEVTGRAVARRQVRGGDLASGNSKEILRFQKGERRVICLTAAGALGLNLVSPHPMRVYLLEVPWVPEVLAQQLGRCNRTTSRAAPECFSVTLKTFVEKRVEVVLAGRAQTLGALSCADRSAQPFSMLAWSKRLLRLVSLELAARWLAERLPVEEGLKPVLRTRIEGERLGGKRFSLMPQLELSEALTDAENATPARETRLLEAILSQNPDFARKLWPAWHASEAKYLHATDQQRARVALLSLHRAGLPYVLIDVVLQFALPCRWSVREFFEQVPQHLGLLRADLQQFFNSTALLPLQQQRRLYQACEENHELLGEKKASIKTVVEHCCARKAPPPGFSVAVRTQVLTDSERGIEVCFRDEVTPCAAPCLFQTSTGHVVHIQGGVWRYPGRPPMDRRDGATAPTLRDAICLNALRRYREAEARSLHQRRSVAKMISAKLTLRLQSPLKYWDQSLGKVLAVPASQQQEAFVGLLMR